MGRPADDLYAALGVHPTASAEELRRVFEHRRGQADPRSPSFARAAQAYAVLGDPRLRNEYDRGRTVGVGTGPYFNRGGGEASGTPVRPTSCDPDAGTRSRRVAMALSALLFVAMAVRTAQMPEVKALFATEPPRSPLAAAATGPPATPEQAPGVAGTCLSSDVQRSITPGRTVPCEDPHLFEVTSVIDLGKLLGRAPAPSDEPVVHEVCDHAFTAYTGLPGATSTLYPSGVTLLATPPETSWALCLAGSSDWRTTSSRDTAPS